MFNLLNWSPQRQLPRLLNKLYYLSVHLEVLCSSFFGRPLPLMYQWTHNSITYNMIKSILFTFSKANICCYKILGKKVKRQLAALGFTPRHDVLQELLRVEHCRPLSRTRTKKPVATNGRREDYVRLPFVDDLCLRCAMQGFLRRKLSSKAKLTRRQTKSS